MDKGKAWTRGAWTRALPSRYFWGMRACVLLLCLLPLACAPGMPDLGDRMSANAQAQAYPSLVPLGPLLARAEAPLARSAATEGTSLEARAADLRRRANQLRNMAL